MDPRTLVVIGGSAGAVETVTALLRQLPADFAVPICVALHVAPLSSEWLSAHIGRLTHRRVVSPEGEQPIEAGHVYVARPDRHLLVKAGRVLSSSGPRENLWRPAIDVLFRTAAVAYGNRVIAVLMSGELDDGTAGLQAVKTCGGITIVQHPQDVRHPAMLRTALANVQVDHRPHTSELAPLLERLAREPPGPVVPIPEQLRREAQIAQTPQTAPDFMQEQGSPGGFSCPECSGPLWPSHDGQNFRCLVGHSFHIQSLAAGADQEIERTLWAAIRLFEQRVNIARMMGEQERERGRDKRAELYDARARESQDHAQKLRELHRRGRVVLDEPPEEG